MAETADFIVAGAGHNSLITAAYLAKAGYSCLVLDARSVPGGGVATEELMAPGYLIDSCATGHTLIRVNPLLAQDELGLHSKYGLKYIEPDPVGHVAFPDGEHLTMWLDLERTYEEIAHFSKEDADAYRRLIADYDAVKGPMGAGRFVPPGFGPSIEQRLMEVPGGARWLRIRAMSAWDVIRHEFHERHVQSFMLWMAFQTVQSVDIPGSGDLAYSLIYGRQQRSWSIPVGGSGKLTDALVQFLEEHGARVICNRRVSRLLLEGDRCVGVETDDGEQYRAGTGVVSTIHVKHLVDMAPHEAWGSDFVYGVETYDIGIGNTAMYIAATEPPKFAKRDGTTESAVSAGTVGWPEDVIKCCRMVRDGEFVWDSPWLLVATPTLVDPQRAPNGHHTVKIMGPQAWQLPPGESSWDELKKKNARNQLEYLRRFAPNFTDDVILDMLIKSPDDIEKANPHMIHGTFHGGDRGLSQSGGLRPVPGYGQYRMPIKGLYQTGGTTHPGGSVTGGPGRNAAMVILKDLGTTLEDVVAGRAAAPAGAAR